MRNVRKVRKLRKARKTQEFYREDINLVADGSLNSTLLFLFIGIPILSKAAQVCPGFLTCSRTKSPAVVTTTGAIAITPFAKFVVLGTTICENGIHAVVALKLTNAG